MTRKELYAVIKSEGLADAIKAMYGENYTRVSNKDLEEFITFRNTEEKGDSPTENSPAPKKTLTAKAIKVTEANPFRMAYLSSLIMLKAQGLLDDLLKEVNEAFDK